MFAKIKHFIITGASIGFMATALNASALALDLGLWNPPPGTGGSAADELAFLNSTVLTTSPYNNLGLPTATTGTDNIDATGLSISLNVDDWSYLKLQWDGKWQYYYVGNDSGNTLTFNSTAFNQNGQPQGLSHYTFFGPETGENIPGVPDGGSTVMLVGAALTGLATLRRWLVA